LVHAAGGWFWLKLSPYLWTYLWVSAYIIEPGDTLRRHSEEAGAYLPPGFPWIGTVLVFNGTWCGRSIGYGNALIRLAATRY
jgi:hypothetical protein